MQAHFFEFQTLATSDRVELFPIFFAENVRLDDNSREKNHFPIRATVFELKVKNFAISPKSNFDT